MAWLDKIEAPLKITCGDGKSFEPFNVFSSKEVEYNIAQFDFPNVKGSIVKRGQPKGNKYALEIYFQGEEHIELATDFLTSADDPRAWIITHPYYGSIDVQPVKLKIDNSAYNITKITGTVIETLSDVFPSASVVPEDKIVSDKNIADETGADTFAANNPEPSLSDKTEMNTTVDSLEASTLPTITDDVEASKFKNAVNEARAAINTATNAPLQAMRKIQAVVNAPLLLQQNLQQKLNLITDQFTDLVSIFTNDPNPSKSSKHFAETTLSTLTTVLAAVSAVNGGGSGGFGSRSGVGGGIEKILATYNTLITTLDSLQTTTGSETDSYIPDPDLQIEINNIISFTVSNLLQIALDSRQERVIFLEEDSDPISLSHRFYGLKADDSTIDEFIATNNIGLSEILLIRKGREILYYV